jgi:hypothetical protein
MGRFGPVRKAWPKKKFTATVGKSDNLTEAINCIRIAKIGSGEVEGTEIIRGRIDGTVRSSAEGVKLDGISGEVPDYLAGGVDSPSLAICNIAGKPTDIIGIGVYGPVWICAEGVYRRHAIRLANHVTGVIDATGKAAIELSRVEMESAEVIRRRIQTLVGSRAECVLCAAIRGEETFNHLAGGVDCAAELAGPKSSVAGLMGLFGAVRKA